MEFESTLNGQATTSLPKWIVLFARHYNGLLVNRYVIVEAPTRDKCEELLKFHLSDKWSSIVQLNDNVMHRLNSYGATEISFSAVKELWCIDSLPSQNLNIMVQK